VAAEPGIGSSARGAHRPLDLGVEDLAVRPQVGDQSVQEEVDALVELRQRLPPAVLDGLRGGAQHVDARRQPLAFVTQRSRRDHAKSPDSDQTKSARHLRL
jgi:hypothetical protein